MGIVAVIWTYCLAINSIWLWRSELKPSGPGRLRCGRNPPDDSVARTMFSVVIRITNFFMPLLVTWFDYVAVLFKMWNSHKKV